MDYLTVDDILYIHERQIASSGGDPTILDRRKVESAAAQPRMTFAGDDLYPTLAEKAAALGFSIIKNHPFLDGNKRTGYAAVEAFLWINGFEVESTTEDQYRMVLGVASGEIDRDRFAAWLAESIGPARPPDDPTGVSG